MVFYFVSTLWGAFQTLEEDLKLRKVFTLNMIDRMSYYDLKQLLINIEREEELGVENFTIEEDKPKEFTKKIN